MPSQKFSATPSQPQKSYKHIAVIFIVLAFLLIIGVTYLALSKVTITLYASDSRVNHSFNLTIANNPTNNTSTSVIVNGAIFNVEKETEGQFFVESDEKVESLAEGEVILFNERAQDQKLVATTRLLTDQGILFRLKDDVTVPAKGSIKALVRADEKGASGDISAAKFTIPGLSEELQPLVYARSDKPMTGGIRQVGKLTATDVEKAEKELFEKTESAQIAEWKQTLNDSLILVGEKIELNNVISNKIIGDEVDTFILSGKIVAQAVFANIDDILNMAKIKMAEAQGPKGEFTNIDPSSLKYELLSVDAERQEAVLKIDIAGLLTLAPEKDMFDKNLLVGFTEEDLRLYFSQFDSVKDIDVSFSPFWVKKVPILRDHIMIEVK